MKKRKLILGLNCSTDYSITDNGGRVYTIEEAKRLWETNEVDDYNMAFWRLVQNRWDMAATKAQIESL